MLGDRSLSHEGRLERVLEEINHHAPKGEIVTTKDLKSLFAAWGLVIDWTNEARREYIDTWGGDESY